MACKGDIFLPNQREGLMQLRTPIEVRLDDLSSPAVQALVHEHVAGMRGD